MDENTENECFAHLWQKKQFKYEENIKKNEKVESLRYFLGQLDYVKAKDDSLQCGELDFVLEKYLSEYGETVDNQQNGLNNYAEPIFTLLENCKNLSQSWKSGISIDDTMQYIEPLNSNPGLNELEEEFEKFGDLMSKRPVQNKEELLTEIRKKFNPLDSREENEILNNENSHLRSEVEGNKSFFKSSIGGNQISLDNAENNSKSWTGMFQPSNNHKNVSKESSNLKENKFENFREAGPSFSKRMCNDDRDHQREEHMRNRGLNENESFSHFESNKGRNFSRGQTANHGRSKNYPWNKFSNNDHQKKSNVSSDSFKTASHQLTINQMKKQTSVNRRSNQLSNVSPNSQSKYDYENEQAQQASGLNTYGLSKKCLGMRRNINSKFVPPVRRDDDSYDYLDQNSGNGMRKTGDSSNDLDNSPYAEMLCDERLKNIEPKMVELIMNEIMDNAATVTWDDIAGLELAKSTIQEIVVWPMLRPDIFTGLRGPPKGILLFGPPGTGKTMIGKCIASQSHSTFFSISASSLTSKWIGEGEKMVRALFAVARCHQPAVIFIDEIDSLLTQRSESEHESSRRIKTEFLVQLDGATTAIEDRLLLVGATNRPQELDEAARRRLVKRLYIPLPDALARKQIIINLLATQNHTLTSEAIEEICSLTDGYSGADVANLCREAALGPIRSIKFSDIQHISVDEVRPISGEDLKNALKSIRASVSSEDLHMYLEWNKKFGIYGR